MRNLLGTLPLGLLALGQSPVQRASDALAIQTQKFDGCPVGFGAQRAQTGALLTVSPGARQPRPSFRILFAPGKKGIAQATVTLHGFAGSRLLPAGDTAVPSSSGESFHLSPASGVDHLLQSTISPAKFTALESVSLNEVIYTDGTSWHESPTATCRVAPNGFMLVATSH